MLIQKEHYQLKVSSKSKLWTRLFLKIPMFSEYIAIMSNLGCSFRPAKPFEMTGDTDSSMVFLKKEQAVSFLDSSFVKPPFVEYFFRFFFIFSNLSGPRTKEWHRTDPASVSFHGLNADCNSLTFDQHLLAPSMSSYQQAFFPASSFHHDNFVTQKGWYYLEVEMQCFLHLSCQIRLSMCHKPMSFYKGILH